MCFRCHEHLVCCFCVQKPSLMHYLCGLPAFHFSQVQKVEQTLKQSSETSRVIFPVVATVALCCAYF